MKRFYIRLSISLFLATSAMAAEKQQQQLLELAFSSASKMPLEPHIKNRSRAQRKVVETCLDLDLPQQAETYIKQIKNWQRWLGFADLAHYYAEHGDRKPAKEALQQARSALQMADALLSKAVLSDAPSPLIDSLEGWRYNRVEARIYEVEALLENDGAQPSTHPNLGEALDAAFAARYITRQQANYDAAMKQLTLLADNANFEVVQQALLGMVRLADAHYEQIDPAGWLGENIVPHFKKTPVFVRVDVLVEWAKVTLRHNDALQAGKTCDRIERSIDAAALPAGLHIVEKAKVVALRFGAGEEEAARKLLDRLRRIYPLNRDSIIDINRAAILCRLAEAFEQTGQRKPALELYQMAISEGQINPNSRPRLDALNEICCSMALYSVHPPKKLFQSLERMGTQLGRPW